MKVAVIGLGYWGPNLVRNLYENQLCDQIVCCDLDPDRVEKIKKRYPSLEYETDVKKVIARDDIEAAVVATHVSSHYPLAKDLLTVGKHVFIEKPMASTRAEAEGLITLAEQKNRIIMIGHTFEYSPPVLKIKRLIEKGELGDIFFITSSRVNLGLHQKDVSVIWDLAPHDFSILFYWLDEQPIRVSAMGKDYVQKGIPDVAFINLEFASGCVAHVQVSWLAPSKLRRTAVVGSNKMLVYDDTENIEKVKIYDKGVDFKDPETFGEFQLSYRTGDVISPRLETFEPLGYEMKHFIESCNTGTQPRSNGYSGLRVVNALEASEESLKNNSKVVEIPK
jgi:predicted dehydrogenase